MTELYYFSGTGNSLYIAKELQKRIPGTSLIPIAGLLHADTIKSKADTVGIVFPLQGPTMPNVVKLFLQKADFVSADYLFAVATRGGTTCSTRKHIDAILCEKGKKLNAHFAITVFNNDPKLKSDGSAVQFHIPSAEELEQRSAAIAAKLDAVQTAILNKEDSFAPDTDYFYKYSFWLEQLVMLGIRMQGGKGIHNYFYADSKCIGCGQCEKVCLSGKIRMTDGKPHWDEDTLCYMCYACLNYCPQEAVQIHSKWYMKSYTAVQGRYSHPYASADDIAKQKLRVNEDKHDRPDESE
jgi:ferredoxin